MASSNPTDFTAANRAFFNDLAAKYDISPWQQHMLSQITNFIQQNLGFICIPNRSEDPTTLLDYACGTGMMSRALGPSVTSIRALDLSTNMIERYNELAASSEIPSVRSARAIEGNLLKDDGSLDELNGPEFHNFDIAAIGTALHHFDDAEKAIGRLAGRLRVGGVLLILDFVDEKGEHGNLPTGADHTIRKNGFSEREMKEMMEGNGLTGFGWKEMPERLEMKLRDEKPISRKGFLARAEKV